MEDRREHVEQIIKPSLERGKVVITDRYYYSSVAYQGALGLNANDILAANEVFRACARPGVHPGPAGHRGPGAAGKKGKGTRQVSESFPYLKQVEAIYKQIRRTAVSAAGSHPAPMKVHVIILARHART